jgi:hypothetical protein
MKGKRREDPRSLLKDIRMLTLSAYAHQSKILLGRIDVSRKLPCPVRAGYRQTIAHRRSNSHTTVDPLAAPSANLR